MQKTIQIEFFHDVICSFCFPMSYRMRQIEAKYPNVKITHRSFALAPDVQAFQRMFGSHEQAKTEILAHWEHANQNDDLHRFNTQGMQEKNFLFPTSMSGLLACKAAYFIDGDAGYWRVFDALQNSLFVQNEDISQMEIIQKCVEISHLNYQKWLDFYKNPATRTALEADFMLAQGYQLSSVPALVVENQYVFSGALSLAKIEEGIHQIASLKGVEILEQTNAAGLCHIDNGKINCH